MALSAGNNQFGGGLQTGIASQAITITSTLTSGVLVGFGVFDTAASPVPSVSSTSLGSWGAARGSGFFNNAPNLYIYQFTRAFSAQLTAEVVTFSVGGGTSSANYLGFDVFEIDGTASSGYFDPNGSLPAYSATTAVSITNNNAYAIKYAAWALNSAPAATVPPGWTALQNVASTYLFVAYEIVYAGATDSPSVSTANSVMGDAIDAAPGPDAFGAPIFRIRQNPWR